MQNYNQQQQAIILKGIANQILQMNVPTFSIVDNLLGNFGAHLFSQKQYDAIEAVDKAEVELCNKRILELEEKVAGMYSGEFVHTVIETLLVMMGDKNVKDIAGKEFSDKIHTVKHFALKLEENNNLCWQKLHQSIFEDAIVNG